ALLVVARAVLNRTDAGGDDEQPIAELALQRGRLHAGGDHPVAARFERAARARQHQRLDVTTESQVVEVALVEAGQHGHREDLHIALGLARGDEHRLVAVHRGERDSSVAQPAYRGRDRLGNVEELQVGKDLVAPLRQPVDELERSPGHEQLQPDLVETDAVAQSLNERLRLGGARNVQRRDQPLLARNALTCLASSSRRPRGRPSVSSAWSAIFDMSFSRLSPLSPPDLPSRNSRYTSPTSRRSLSHTMA